MYHFAPVTPTYSPTSVVWLASASNHRAFYDNARPGCKPITKELYVGESRGGGGGGGGGYSDIFIHT